MTKFFGYFFQKVTELADCFRDRKVGFHLVDSSILYHLNLNKVGSAANLSAKY
ncbi:hypothetical protein F937_02946 [Acinetobacter calcoaceticus ANC 3680]|nr:hypothetical protein F937_02946 [Acinetobacter calcoaceticus ANC 3680]